MIMQSHLWSSKHMHSGNKKQSSTLYSIILPLLHEIKGQTDMFHEFVNAGKNGIAINNNKEVGSKIHQPYIKLSGGNRTRIQQPMRSNSEVFAPLTHVTTLDEAFHIRDHIGPPHTMSKSLERFMNGPQGHCNEAQ